MARIRRDVRWVRTERKVLAQTPEWFGREADSIPVWVFDSVKARRPGGQSGIDRSCAGPEDVAFCPRHPVPVEPVPPVRLEAVVIRDFILTVCLDEPLKHERNLLWYVVTRARLVVTA